jgi:DNA repair photolyase
MNQNSKLPNTPSKGKKNTKPVTGTREWAATNANFINGCSHDCKYCYAKSMAIRFKRKTSANWKIEEINIKKFMKNYKKKDGSIMFPTSHDITPENVEYSIGFLESLLLSGNNVLIVTKPHIEVVDAICTQFRYFEERILFRFTIGSVDSEILKFWEPNAPSFEERLFSLEHAHCMGFKTSVSCEPALDTNTIKLAETLLPYVTDAVWLGKANRLKGIIKLNCGDDLVTQKAAEKLEKSQTDEWVFGLYQHFKDNPKIKWKESMKKVLGLERPTEMGLDI